MYLGVGGFVREPVLDRVLAHLMDLGHILVLCF